MKRATKLVLSTATAGTGLLSLAVIWAAKAPSPVPLGPLNGYFPFDEGHDEAKYNALLHVPEHELTPKDKHWMKGFEAAKSSS